MPAASSRGTLRDERQPARHDDWRFRLTEQRTIETTTTDIDPAPRDPATTVVVADSGRHGGEQVGGAVVGGIAGATVGAVVGGPVGAVVGGAIGAATGTTVGAIKEGTKDDDKVVVVNK
jgi:uncharacterized protein YcfJ